MISESIDNRIVAAGVQKEVFLSKDAAVDQLRGDWGTSQSRSDFNQDGRVNALDFNALAVLPMGSRNPMCWAADIDLSCASPWNSAGSNLQAGTLIHPSWIALAAHYGYGVGTEVTFVSMANRRFTGIIDRIALVPDTDILLAHFEKPIDSAITVAKVLPPTWGSVIPNYGYGLPALVFDQEEKALISDVATIFTDVSLTKYTAHDRRMLFYEDKISGDSGNPIFWINGKDVIVLGHLMYGGAGRGPSYAWNRFEIEDAIGDSLQVATL